MVLYCRQRKAQLQHSKFLTVGIHKTVLHTITPHQWPQQSSRTHSHYKASKYDLFPPPNPSKENVSPLPLRMPSFSTQEKKISRKTGRRNSSLELRLQQSWQSWHPGSETRFSFMSPFTTEKKDGEELQAWSLTFVKRTHTKMPCKLWVVVMNVGDDKMLPVISTETQWVVPDSREFPCNFHPMCFRWQEDKLQHIPDGSAYLWDDSRQGAARQSTAYCHTHLRTSLC